MHKHLTYGNVNLFMPDVVEIYITLLVKLGHTQSPAHI